ncbi:uncharacterized protein LOC121739083 [Aricia agestis]|uniref:uncharacterized protein LOC121739083 n=1 Tax=Aricia agestis TaxID=91739 RepID=UPI001C20B8A8|nr:uncharacterized protein LOC121739083 [Aricia agestis]
MWSFLKPERKNTKVSIMAPEDSTTKRQCAWQCTQLPKNVPSPGLAQNILHPKKDVFLLKVAKIGPNGDRRCKMELELVTPKAPERKLPGRYDTKETQCDNKPSCSCLQQKKRRQ